MSDPTEDEDYGPLMREHDEIQADMMRDDEKDDK